MLPLAPLDCMSPNARFDLDQRDFRPKERKTCYDLEHTLKVMFEEKPGGRQEVKDISGGIRQKLLVSTNGIGFKAWGRR